MGHRKGDVLPVTIRQNVLLFGNPLFGRFKLAGTAHFGLTALAKKVTKNEKRNRVNFEQQILVDSVVYADVTFVATYLISGRPTVPEIVMNAIVD
ncbi:hypothetical protein SAMN05421579_12016 [Xenorhabdus japonica]|uniref:Uncharacterized protein n=1 Tax=Xenorhabdus japonica TaxID=53341 RepID=A0A1I5BL62_9GAMM|nr:hypothetical protein SAMN05421579_12016 [Xenorhabdus japonica]